MGGLDQGYVLLLSSDLDLEVLDLIAVLGKFELELLLLGLHLLFFDEVVGGVLHGGSEHGGFCV